MKYFIVLSVIIACVVCASIDLTEEQKAKAKEHVKACIVETGVDPEVVKKLKSGDFSDKSEKIQCFAKCFFEKAGFINAAGELQENVIVEKLSMGSDRATVEKKIGACKNVKGANDCETVYKVYECYKAAN